MTERPTECAACHAALRPNARFCPKCGSLAPVCCAGCSGWNLAGSLFCEHCGVSLPPSERRGPQTSGLSERALDQILPPSVRFVGNPERRQTTILFCDLVGSTRLSGELDPEDLREVLHVFREVSRAVISRHGGFIANYMGDGVLVLFAYPQAHEDDPQRAVRAGLELVTAIRAVVVRHGVKLEARIGIATGIAVIGPLVSSDGSIDDMIAGQTINLAARLQSLAAPNAVVISGATQRLVATTFECASLGSHALKGFETAVPAWSVIRERNENERVASSPPNLLPLIGREREIELMRSSWSEVCGGRGSLIIVQGEPGLGKSRLITGLREIVNETPHAVLRYLCAPRFSDSALYPVIRQLERTADINPDDTPGKKLDKLEAFLAFVDVKEELPDKARVLAALLAVPFEDRYAPIVDSPEKLKQRTFQVLKETLYATAGRVPVLLIIEDLHWADPTTIELFDAILTNVDERPILSVATVRTGFGGATPQCTRTVHLDLQRLNAEQSAEVVAHVASDRQLRAEVVAHIIRKSEGVPLFAEELTKAALEHGAFDADDEPRSPQYLAAQAIPSTLQDSLAARLDRLSLVKEVALVASTIGRDFTLELLAGVLEIPEPELRASLRTLVSADLIRLHNEALGVYSFKHALLQEAAYTMMLRGTRQKLHKRVANLLETKGADTTVGNYDLMTHHLIEAGEPVRAIPYLELAARRASGRAAHTEARRYLLRGMDLISIVPPGRERDQLELGLSVELGLATSATQGYASPEVQAAYQRSLDLSRSLGATAQLFPALRGLCTFYIVRAALETARGLAEECLRLAETSQAPADVIESSTALGYTLVYQGSLAEGIVYLDQAIVHYRQNNGEQLAYPSLQDPAVASLALQAIAAWMAGEIRRADRLQAEALELAERLTGPFNIAYAYSFAALLGNIRYQYTNAAKHAVLARQVAEQHGFAIWQGAATIHESIALGHSSDPAAAIPVLVHMLGLWQAGGAELSRPLFLWGLAHCRRAVGDAEGALQTLDEALAQSDRTGEGFLRPELHRMRGELLHAQAPDQDELWRKELRLAVACAKTQGARLLELRALTALCSRTSDERNGAEFERLTELTNGLRDAGEEAPELAKAEALFR